MTSAGMLSANIFRIFVRTSVCVKAATRDALDERGGLLRSPTYAPAMIAPGYDVFRYISGPCDGDEHDAYGAYRAERGAEQHAHDDSHEKGTGDKDIWVNPVDTGGDDHRYSSRCLPHGDEPSDEKKNLYYANR